VVADIHNRSITIILKRVGYEGKTLWLFFNESKLNRKILDANIFRRENLVVIFCEIVIVSVIRPD